VRRRKKEQRAAEQAAAEAAAGAPAGRRTVAAPVAGGPPPAATPNAAGAPAEPAAALQPTVPDRVDALTEAIGGELGRLRGEMRGRDADLVQALQQVAASYDRVAAKLDDERRVQVLLAEALVRIDRRLAAIEGSRTPAPGEGAQLESAGTTPGTKDDLPRPQRVIGGSISPRQDIPRLDR
jgi:hypothetical protein